LIYGHRENTKLFFKWASWSDLCSNPSNVNIYIISPYISIDTVEDVLSPLADWPSQPKVTIVCSWRSTDLVANASDIEIYNLCKSKGWDLRVDHDNSLRKIHLKAYVLYPGSLSDLKIIEEAHIEAYAIIGSANMTRSGFDSNVEYLHMVQMIPSDATFVPGEHEPRPNLADAIKSSLDYSIPVDDEVYESIKKHLDTIPPKEKEKIPKWAPPEPVADLSDLAEYILNKMPPRPSLRDIMQVESIDRALNIRGLRFGETRAFLRDKLPKDTTREELNQKTNQVIQEIVQSKSDFDIQKRYGTDCLVWKIHPILNEEIMRNLEPYLGRPIRELGLNEELWESNTLGSKPMKISEVCHGLLPIEIRECVQRLSTWQGTLRLAKGDKALYPRPFGERLRFTTNDGELLRNASPSIRMDRLLPEERIRHELWLPAFCLFEAPKRAKLGDAVLRGFGLWESGREFVASMERDFDSDIEVLSEQSNPFFENPFRKASETEVIHTKVAALGGKTGFPLGHPERPMSRYLNTSSLTGIARDILSHDH